MRPITPKNNNGAIRIRFRLAGQQFSFNPIPGGHYDDPDDLKAALAIATQIEGDIRTGNFDPTLAKYGPTQSIQRGIDQANQALKELRHKRQGADLWELWKKYREFKAPQLAPSTLAIDYGRRMAFLEGLDCRVTDAVEVRDWIVANKPPAQGKRILRLLTACCEWACNSGLIEINPFVGLAAEIRVKAEEGEINPFTPTERDTVIAAFESSPYFAHYAPLVRFLFATGCRPSEAIPLRFSDLKGDKLTFQRTYSEGQLSNRLKTQKKRTIRLNESALLAVQASKVNDPNKAGLLIFSAPQGGFIDWHNFANRAWASVLGSLPEIEYRNPKQMRHSFITERILAGDSPADVSRYVGNSPGTIYRNYLGFSRDYSPD